MEGVNDRTQLCAAEEQLQARILRRLRLEGVTVREGARVDSGVVVERDAVVESYAVLRGARRAWEPAPSSTWAACSPTWSSRPAHT